MLEDSLSVWRLRLLLVFVEFPSGLRQETPKTCGWNWIVWVWVVVSCCLYIVLWRTGLLFKEWLCPHRMKVSGNLAAGGLRTWNLPDLSPLLRFSFPNKHDNDLASSTGGLWTKSRAHKIIPSGPSNPVNFNIKIVIFISFYLGMWNLWPCGEWSCWLSSNSRRKCLRNKYGNKAQQYIFDVFYHMMKYNIFKALLVTVKQPPALK